jgi:methyl-accepting chemotaxis protein
MKIKTRLFSIGTLVLVALLVFGGVIFYINKKSTALEQKKNHVDELITTVFERNTFFYDYLLFSTNRAKQQLLTSNKAIDTHLSKLLILLTDKDETAEVRYIQEINHVSISRNLDTLLSIDKGVSQETRNILALQIFEKSQSTVQISESLRQKYQKTLKSLRATTGFVLAGFGLFATLLVLGAIFEIFSIVRSMKKLEDGAVALTKGDLTHRIKINARNEIGLLGDILNDMAEELTVSHSKLQKSKEVLEDRVRAQTIMLTEKIALLEQFKEITEEREHKMIELKRQISTLKKENNL